MFKELFKLRGSKSARRNQSAAFEYSNIIGNNYADSIYAMAPNQSPYAQNTDFGRQIGAISKVKGYEALFASLGEGKILGLHNFKHSTGDYLLAAHDKYLYVLTGDTGVISKTSQADWAAGTHRDLDLDTAAGDMTLEAGQFSDVATLTADFDGTHSGTVATSNKVQLSSAAVARAQIARTGATPQAGGNIVDATRTAGQTFLTLANTTNISEIALQIMSYPTPVHGVVTCKIYDSPAKTTLLGTTTLDTNTDKTSPNFVFADPVLVSPNTTYYYELTATGSTIVGIGQTQSSYYAGGQAYSDGEALNNDLVGYIYSATPASGTYTHGVVDPSAEGEGKDIYIEYHKTTPTGTYATVEVRLSTNGGTSWGDWFEPGSGEVLIPVGTAKAGYRIQWRVRLLTNLDGVNPSLDDVSILTTHAAYGTWESPTYDLGHTPATATLTVSQTVPGGTKVTWYARASSNNTIFGDWQEIWASGDSIPLQRYVQIKCYLTSPSPYTTTPTVSGFVIAHSTDYTQARRLSIEPLGRADNLLTGNRVRFCNYGDWCLIADGLRPICLYLESGTQETGTAQAGGASAIVLGADASDEDDRYNNTLITITAGAGAGQVRWISDYDGTTKRATISEPLTTELVGANLLTDNQADVEFDTSGFSAFSSATLTRDTGEHWHGSASLKVVTPNAVAGEGVYVDKNTGLAVGQAYAASVYVKGAGSVRLGLRETSGGVEATTYGEGITLTSEWQRLTVSHVVTDANNTLLRFMVKTLTQQSAMFYVDGLQVEQGSTASEWRLPSDTSNQSTYSIGSAFKVRNLGVDVPADAPSGVAGAAGNPNGAYLLMYTYVNEDGVESNPSPASSTVTVSSKRITWTIPVDATAYNRTASRRLYRTAAGGAVYKYLGEIGDNTTTTFTDNVTDVGLGSLMLDNNNVPPEACSLIAEFTSYVFYIDAYEVWFSKAGNPDQVPNTAGDIQQMVFQGRVLDIKAHPMALLIGGEDFMATITSNTGFIFDSDPTIDTTTTKVIDTNGSLSAEGSAMCLSPQLRSTLVIPTHTGIRAMIPGLQDNSLESVPLSRNVQPYYEQGLNRDQCAAVFYNNYYIFSMEYQGAEGAEPEHITLAYDLRTEQWYGPWRFGMGCYTIVDNQLYAGSAVDGTIYRMFTGSTFAGADIEMVCDLPMRSPGGEQGTYKFARLTAIVDSESDTSETVVKVKVDNWERIITLGTLVDAFTGDERPGHNIMRSRKYPIFKQGHTISLRVEDNSPNPVTINKLIVEYETLNLNI